MAVFEQIHEEIVCALTTRDGTGCPAASARRPGANDGLVSYLFRVMGISASGASTGGPS